MQNVIYSRFWFCVVLHFFNYDSFLLILYSFSTGGDFVINYELAANLHGIGNIEIGSNLSTPQDFVFLLDGLFFIRDLKLIHTLSSQFFSVF